MKIKSIVVAVALALCAAQVFGIADAAKFKFKKGINVSRLESWTTTSAGYLGQDSTYTSIKAKGFDHLRLPVYLKNYYNSSSQTLKTNISVIDGILDKCEANGLYVFLDFHGWSGINTTNGTDRVDFLKIWELVAERYSNRSDYVIYELINEPHTNEGGNLDVAHLNALQAEVLPLIRQHDPNRLVLLAAAEWNGAWKLSELVIPSNPGPIGVVCHTYGPMNFTHQGATWGGFSTDHVSFTSTDKTSETGTGDLDNAFRWIDDFQEKTGVPVVMNEFGVNKQNSKATDAEVLDWTSYVARNCESNGIAWTWWEYNQGFGAYYYNQWRAPVMNGLFPAEPAGNTYADTFDAADYAKKVTVTFPGYAGSSALENFPVLVKLSTAITGFSYADFKRANGDDLRFTDAAGNLIPHEVDTWNSNGVSTVWVKVPSLTASTKITAHYGCSLPAAVDSSAVWTNGYVGVWHLGEGGLPLRESSRTSTDFTKQDGSGIKYAQAGAIGGSVDFGKSGGRRMVTAHDCDALDGFTNFTVEAWTYQTSNTTAAILSKRYSSSKNLSYFLYHNGSKTQFNVANADSTSGNSAQLTPSLNQWTHQSYTFSAGTIKGYMNGAKVGSDKTVSFSTVNASDGYLHLGNFNREGAWNAESRNFPGKIDEVRISNVARSADWMQATYDTVQKEGFAAYTFGDVPDPDPGPVEYGPLATNLYAKSMNVLFAGAPNTATLTNFPVLVKLSTAIDGFSYADFSSPNGGDLRFADANGNLLPHEIDTWNSNGVSTAWVKIPALTRGTAITAHYGYTGSGSPAAVDSKDVWDDDYVGVWHLGEGALPMKESSETSSDFTSSYGATVGYGADGIVGRSVNFPSGGLTNALVAADHDALDGFSKFTIETWTLQDAHKQNAGILSKRKEYNKECAYYVYDSGETVAFCVGTNRNTAARWCFNQNQNLGEWTYLAYTADMASSSKNVHGYKNGTMNGWEPDAAFFGPMPNSTEPLILGNLGANKPDYAFNGKIDEVRISKTVRSKEWVKATYDTIADQGFAVCSLGEIDLGESITNLLLKASTDKENPIDYVENENIRFDFRLDGVLTLPLEVRAKEPLHVIWTRTADDGVTVKGTNTISLAQGCSVTTSLAIPGIVKMTATLVGSDYKAFSYVNPADGKTKNITFGGGAGVATEKMQLTTVEPADFDQFWADAKAKLATVPLPTDGSELTEVFPKTSNTNSYRYFAAKIPCYGPRPVTGWIIMPRNPQSGGVPIQANFDGYGCISKAPSLPTGGVGQKVYFAVNAHGYDMIGHDDQYYKDFNDYINKTNRTFNGTTYGYACAPQDYDNPTNTYFYYMAMRIMRAYQYLKTRPEWNGRDVVAEGGSQGGLQTMWAGGLVDGITKIRPSITWGCDIGCPWNGNGNPYPSRTWGIPSVPGAYYFDSALHAKRVPRTCIAEITRLGMGDYTCPPRGVLLSYYNMKCAVSAKLVQGSDHGYIPPQPNQQFTISKDAEPEPPAPLPAVATDAAGFDYTNRIVTVTGLAAGATVTLATSGSNGATATLTATADANGEATFSVATAPGTEYSYTIAQGGEQVAAGGFFTGGWNAGRGWFSASAEGGSSVVSGGDWTAAPAIQGGKYVIDGAADFALGEDAVAAGSGRFVRAEFDVKVGALCDAGSLAASAEQEYSCLAAAEDSTAGTTLWMASGAEGWKPLYGDVAPQNGSSYIVRAEADFAANPPKVRYEVSADGGANFSALFTDSGRTGRWLACSSAGSALSGVGFEGEGAVASFGGTLSNANVAETDGVGYESLADAIAAATNSLALLTNATWPTNTPVGTVAVSLGGYALDGVALDGNGRAVVSSGYSAIPGEGKVNITLAQAAALGVSTTGKSPAQIASALAANGANGIPLWKSYALGLDPGDPTAKPKASIAVNGDKVELALVGIDVNAASGATVTYKVYKSADLADMANAEPASGDKSADATALVPKGATEGRMFYQLKVDVKGY